MVVLVGLPGAGKTTFSTKLQQHGIVWVSQDAQGDRQASEILCENALAAGQHVVVDRCNVNRVQRRVWIQIARNVRHRVKKIAVQLVVPFEECKRRVQTRSRHPITPPHKAQEVVERFAKDLHPVFPDEGFDEVQIAYNDSDLDTIANRIATFIAASGASGTNPTNINTQLRSAPSSSRTPGGSTTHSTPRHRSPSPATRSAGSPPKSARSTNPDHPPLAPAAVPGSQPSHSTHASPKKPGSKLPPTHPGKEGASHRGGVPHAGALPRHPYPGMPMQEYYYPPYGMEYMAWPGAVPMHPYEMAMGWRPAAPYGHMYWPGQGMYPPGAVVHPQMWNQHHPQHHAGHHQGHHHMPQWYVPTQHMPPGTASRPLPDPYLAHSEGGRGPGSQSGSPMHPGKARPPAVRPPGTHMMYKQANTAVPMIPVPRPPAEGGQIRAYMPHPQFHPAVAYASPRTGKEHAISAGPMTGAGHSAGGAQNVGGNQSAGEGVGKGQKPTGPNEGEKSEKVGKDGGAIAMLKAKYADATGAKLDTPEDNRIILLFDLNGTLTSHSSKRKSSMRNRLRPGVKNLLRLRDQFRIGLYTSASLRTVEAVHTLLEDAVGEKIIDPSLVLYRDHAQPQAQPHVKAEGGPVEAVKPLAKWFNHLNRVVLFDDDPLVVSTGEERNVVMVPGWHEEDEQCQVMRTLVDSILQVFAPLGPKGDVREVTQAVAKHLASIPPTPAKAPSPLAIEPLVSPPAGTSKVATPPPGLLPPTRGPAMAFAPSTPTAAAPSKIAPLKAAAPQDKADSIAASGTKKGPISPAISDVVISTTSVKKAPLSAASSAVVNGQSGSGSIPQVPHKPPKGAHGALQPGQNVPPSMGQTDTPSVLPTSEPAVVASVSVGA